MDANAFLSRAVCPSFDDVQYYESEESEVNEEEDEQFSSDDGADDEEFIPSHRRASNNGTKSNTVFTIGSQAPKQQQQKKKPPTKKTTTGASASSEASSMHPPYDYPGRPTAVGKDLPDRGRHKCRMPGCTEDYRWPDYLCKIHGGGKCQYFWWDDSVETCPKFHQSKNSKGELLCGEHCRYVAVVCYL